MTRPRHMWANQNVVPDSHREEWRDRFAASCATWQRGDSQRVLVACERSGRVRDWLRLYGIEAWSCDIRPCDSGGPHLECDLWDVAGLGWDCVIAFPPCTYLSRVNVAGRRRNPEREVAARQFVQRIWALPVGLMLLENPVGAAWDVLGRPHQQVDPWQFGDPYTKRTCLWMRGLSPLYSPNDLRVNPIGKWTETRHTARGRSLTFHGIAAAIARSVDAAL